MPFDRDQAIAQNAQSLAWEGEATSFPDLMYHGQEKAPSAPILSRMLPPEPSATHVHSAQVAEIGGVWASGTQAYEKHDPRQFEWDAGYVDVVTWHTKPFLSAEQTSFNGGSQALVADEKAAGNLFKPHCREEDFYGTIPFKNLEAGELPQSPKGIDAVYVNAASVEPSGRLFMSREEAIEDGRILATMKDLDPTSHIFEDLAKLRPAPAFDIENPGKVKLSEITSDSSMSALSYEAGLRSPRLLTAAAALSGALPSGDPRINPAQPEPGYDMVNAIRLTATDRQEAIQATAAGKVLREQAGNAQAISRAFQSLEGMAVKSGNPKVVGAVFAAAEQATESRATTRSRGVEMEA